MPESEPHRLVEELDGVIRGATRPTMGALLDEFRRRRRYRDEDFPLSASRFNLFREQVIGAFIDALDLADWVVASADNPKNCLADRFEDKCVQVVRREGVEVEVHILTITDPGLCVPAVLCLPVGTQRVPGVCCYSGHSKHGLRDLLEPQSYQAGIAMRLASSGIATIAVEKVDAGYLSRGLTAGSDEYEVATYALACGRTTRAMQLKACLAACELLACHRRVEPTRIGAAGVSLGGWLSTETALLTDRIKAVADFGVKTLHAPAGLEVQSFTGIRDICQIIPGLLSVCDRNLHALAYCPRPMLAGHGRLDADSCKQGDAHYRELFGRQYARLGHADRYQYHVHDGADQMPAGEVLRYFHTIFEGM